MRKVSPIIILLFFIGIICMALYCAAECAEIKSELTVTVSSGYADEISVKSKKQEIEQPIAVTVKEAAESHKSSETEKETVSETVCENTEEMYREIYVPEDDVYIAPPTEAEVITENGLTYIGNFLLTAYCPCCECSEGYGTGTAIGTTCIAGRTIAVDPSVIPYGTIVVINDNEYVAEDCGGAINGNRIDVFFDSHAEALEFGVQYADVYARGAGQ